MRGMVGVFRGIGRVCIEGYRGLGVRVCRLSLGLGGLGLKGLRFGLMVLGAHLALCVGFAGFGFRGRVFTGLVHGSS